MRGLLLTLFAAGGLQAQIVEVQVRDDSTRLALVGVIVRLLDESGAVVGGLSGTAGRVTLRAPAPGTYRLTAHRIGHRGAQTPAFALGRGQTMRLDLPMPAEPVRAGPATADVWCGRPPAGRTLAAALWDDAVKALTAVVLTQQTGLARVRVTTFERDLDPDGTHVSERSIHSVITTGPPFPGPEVERVIRDGFVRVTPDSVEYVVPDAALLLVEAFVRTRCFHTVPAERTLPGLAGLAFDPGTERRVPEIQGTLWLDAVTRELKRLEFTYVDVPGISGQAAARGEVVFRRLASGAWIVNDWHTVLPRIVERESSLWPGTRVRERDGFYARGGRVVPVGELPETPPPEAVVHGAVFDSLAGEPLAGVVVWLAGLPDSAVTDGAGRFRLAVPAQGARELTMSHPRLGLVADRSHQVVELVAGGKALVEAAVPGMTRFVQVFCGARAGAAGVLGLAFGAGEPAAGLTVRARWPGGSHETGSSARGVYALCDVPPDTPVTLHLVVDGAIVAERTVRLERGRFLWLEIGRQ